MYVICVLCVACVYVCVYLCVCDKMRASKQTMERTWSWILNVLLYE